MKQLAGLWQSRHRPAVIVAGTLVTVALALGGAMVFWSSAGLRNATMNLNVAQQGLADAEAQAEEFNALRLDLERRESLAHTLRESGFLADTDRVAWAEAVVAAARDLHPAGYSAEVGTQQWLPLPDEVSGWYATRGLEPPSLHATDLVLHVNGLHEDELVGFMHGAMAAGAGVTRIEQCELQRRPDAIGLDAACTLRRFGMGTPPAAVVAGAQTVEVAQ
jgi:hypothetical protein